MPRMRLASGEVYDIPDSDVEMARAQFGAVPADAPAPGVPRFAPPTPSNPMQYLGESDEGLQDPGLLDPLNYLNVGAGAKIGGASLRSIPGVGPLVEGAAELGARPIRALGQALSRPVRATAGLPRLAANRIAGKENVDDFATRMARPGTMPGLQGPAASVTPPDRMTAALREFSEGIVPTPGQPRGGQEAIAEWLTRNPGQPVAEVAEQGSKVAGSIKPGSAASRAKPNTPRKPAKKPAKLGSAETRVKAAKQEVKARETPEGVDSRHEVQYYSESRGKYQNIEGMNQVQIERAYNKLAAKKPKAGSLGRRVLEALLEESKHRARTTGIHVGHAG